MNAPPVALRPWSVRSDLGAYGPLEPLVADASVTDVAVNGPHEVWVDRGEGMIRAGVSFPEAVAVRRLAVRLAASAGRRLDDAAPFADVPLPHGVRMHALLPPLTEQVVLTLRIPRHRTWSLAELVTTGLLPADAEPLLQALVRRRRSFLVSGGAGTGKTTLLNALLGYVDPRERVVVVEDTRELSPEHPHVVAVQTRLANIEGAGHVSLQDLVRQSLRMRPDRIVVGEVRGAEVVDLLTALNTGHEGGCGTLHANTASDVLPRLEALGALGGLRSDAVGRLTSAAVDAVIHLERDASGRRRLATLAVVSGSGGALRVVPAYEVTENGQVRAGEASAQWPLSTDAVGAAS